MRRLQTYQRMRGCGQGDGGWDGVAYYTETVNSNACGICLFKVWEQDFCTASMVLYVLGVTIV